MSHPLSSIIVAQLYRLRSPKSDQHFLDSFWKTRPGQYAQGDKIWGVKVPSIRSLVKTYLADQDTDSILALLYDPVHEVRLFALISLVYLYRMPRYTRSCDEIYDLYMYHIDQVNHRDLVDTSCPTIVGHTLMHRDRDILYQLAHSDHLWRQRIAIVSTQTLIKCHQIQDTLVLAEILLDHPHDLIHKAVGWMLREVGKVNYDALITFLDQYAHLMPSTMCRYAVEHLEPDLQYHYKHRRAL